MVSSAAGVQFNGQAGTPKWSAQSGWKAGVEEGQSSVNSEIHNKDELNVVCVEPFLEKGF